ncbi:MAG: hypothetical protein IJD83_07490 [Clostridia bacterium]|nr:hypothetical protein [Clostridia bacterium]
MQKKKVLIMAVALMLVCIIIGIGTYHKTINTFDTVRWNENIYVREHMLDDLIENHNLKQWDYETVLSNLGEKGLVRKEKTVLLYTVGKGYVGPILFSIHFDESGKITNFEKIVD